MTARPLTRSPQRRPGRPGRPLLGQVPPPIDLYTLPVELRRRRIARGLSLEEVGAMLGYSGRAVGQWECGDADPNWTVAVRWAWLFGLEITAHETQPDA